ncbi:MAG: VWA-like domain-containing protein [Bacilli bacterium]
MKYDIAVLKRKMLVKYPFFGSVVASVDYKENKGITTAGTDGKTIYYNPDFLESLSVEQQTFVFAHEVCHIAFNHILRSEGKEPQTWNIATDAVINAFLKKDGLKMIDGGVDIAEAINYDAEQFYEKLLEEKKQQQGNQPQQQNGQQGQNSQQQSAQQQSQGGSGENQNEQNQNGQNQEKQQQSGQSGDVSSSEEQPNQKGQTGGQSGESSSEQNEQQEKGSSTGGTSGEQDEHEETKEDVGHDTHSMWEDAIKKHKEKQTNENKKEHKSEIEKKQEETEQLGEKKTFKKNLEEKKRELEKLKEAIANQATQAGTTTNRDIRTVTDIGRAKPLIDWRYVLREAIKYDVDWSYKNATIENGVVSANLEEQPMPETEIVLDTSGSINEILLKNFLRECKNILKHSKLKVGCFDTKFYGFHEIRTEEDIDNMVFIGGGGTNFDVAVNAFSRRVENKIIFTDGNAYMPKMPLDAIWIVFGGVQINPKGGKVIQINGEQLERLYNYQLTNETKGRLR